MMQHLHHLLRGPLLLASLVMLSIAVSRADMEERATVEGNKLVYRDQGQTLVIEGWGKDSLRVRITPDGGGQTSDWALDIPLHRDAQIVINPQQATITNGKISARISDTLTQRGYLEFFKHSGDNAVPILREYDHVVDANNPGTRTFKPVGDGLFECEQHFEARDGERLYGMGENAVNVPNKVNVKGCTIDLFQRHMKAVVPLVVSSEGYGFLWNNPSLGKVEFGTNLTRWVSYGCRQLDYFITAGDSYADIMENYADATGHAPEFPYWASGFWQCKLRYQSQEEFLGVAREFKRRNLPLSVLVIDFLHWDVTGNWKLDPRYWPDPTAMVKEMDELGYRIMISPWTLVDQSSENYAYMKEHGLFTGSIGGMKDTVEFSGPKYQYDPTNPEAAQYLWSKWKQNYVDLGIRTFWLDPCDEFHNIEDYDQVLFHIGPAKECHAWFPIAHQKNIYEGLHAAGESEVVTICRNAWAGSQRYGACPAPHDIQSSFEDLEAYMKVGLNVMMSGIPWWSCDIGGFITPDNSSPRFQELMVRWYQYGVFLPVFRTHGNRPNNEPWTIGGDTYPRIRSSILLRERLRPYVMEQMTLASAKGLPPMRPLFFDFSSDPNTADIEDEFLFGPDILAAPVTQFEVRSRKVYLPAGTEWTDAWTGRVIPGGQTVEADAPIEYIPVYLRGNKPELLKLFSSLEMYTFSFGALGAATIDGTNITIILPRGTDVSALAPTYTVFPGCTGSPVSGTPLDFGTPQTYTITAPDGSTKEYRVTVGFGTIYNFNGNSLQGWHNRVWDGTASAWVDLAPGVTTMPANINGGVILPANAGNTLFVSNPGGWTGSIYYPGDIGGGSYLTPGNLDAGANTKWVRSPEFQLDGSGDLTFKLIYGPTGGTLPANESGILYNASQGWSGLCLRDATTGAFVLSQQGTGTHNAYTSFSFTAAQLAALDQSHAYTLDLITTKAGSASWIALDNVSIPGTPATMIYDFNGGTLQGWHNRVWDGTASAWVDLDPNVTTMPSTINGGAILPADAGNSLIGSINSNWPQNQNGIDGTYLQTTTIDAGINTAWARSPQFYLNGSGDLTFALIWGNTTTGTAPANDASISPAATDGGWDGLLLRDATTGQFVLSQQGPGGTANQYFHYSFTAAQLAGLNQTHAYTLDMLIGRSTNHWMVLDNVSIPGRPATYYDTWANGTFANLPFTDTAPTHNPDGDPFVNLLEYAFGMDPTVSFSGSITYADGVVSGHGGLTTQIANIQNGVEFRAVFGRRKDYVGAGLTYKVQFSADLNTWVTSTVEPTVLATDATIEAVSMAYPAFITTSSGDRKPTFFRVTVNGSTTPNQSL